jgi:hypothetical protein
MQHRHARIWSVVAGLSFQMHGHMVHQAGPQAGALCCAVLLRRTFERLLRKLLAFPEAPAIVLWCPYAWLPQDGRFWVTPEDGFGASALGKVFCCRAFEFLSHSCLLAKNLKKLDSQLPVMSFDAIFFRRDSRARFAWSTRKRAVAYRQVGTWHGAELFLVRASKHQWKEDPMYGYSEGKISFFTCQIGPSVSSTFR